MRNPYAALPLAVLVCVLVLSACATAPVQEAQEVEEAEVPLAEEETLLPPEVQREKSISAFHKLLAISSSPGDRQSKLPQMEEIYLQIINEYPDTGLAQESHWKLITLYVKDFSPPEFDKAYALYLHFLENYADSGMRGPIEWELIKGYFIRSRWEDILKVCPTAFETFTRAGRTPKLGLLFICTEADFHLGHYKEAEAGYRNVIELFPDTRERERSEARLEEIRSSGKGTSE